ncbi:erythromycin esterase family protein [Streptomyces sp. NPDC057137]|uniref:erythromycin esterase family protein n=1 Tax=Streptomyces sp. NPDC057137 TaxID=3346030 RepID=UPI00362FE033
MAIESLATSLAIDESLHAAFERFLNERGQRPRLLSLGEPFHGEETFPRLRNDLLRGLVDHARCRCVALESDCLAGRLVDDYVLGGTWHLDQVMADGISHGFGAFPANRALVEWLGEHNRVHAPEDQVRFAGFDAPMENSAESGAHSPRAALDILHTFLMANRASVPHSWSRIEDLLGDEARWTNPAATMDPSQSIGDSAGVRELRLITDDLGRLLTSRAPQFTEDNASDAPRSDAVRSNAPGSNAPGSDALRDAELAARTAAGLLAYHAVLARTDPQERMESCMGIRDAMMAANLHALATREHDHGHGPVLAFTHNEHLRRNAARNVGWSPAGAHLARTYGRDYVAIATAIGSAPHRGIDEPPANTVEGLLAATTSTPRLVPLTELTALVAESTNLTRRTTENRGYFPLDPAKLTDFDTVLFLPHIAPPGPATEAE